MYEQDLINQTDLIGRSVEVYVDGYDHVIGILHSFSEHGVLVREDDGTYFLIPWLKINMIEHSKDIESSEKTESNVEEKTEEEKTDKKEIIPKWQKDITEDKLKGMVMRDRIEEHFSDDSYKVEVTEEGIIISYDDEEIMTIVESTLNVSSEDYISEAKELIDLLEDMGVTEINREYEE